jgi:hypothetical protein
VGAILIAQAFSQLSPQTMEFFCEGRGLLVGAKLARDKNAAALKRECVNFIASKLCSHRKSVRHR